jgi:hypothetical protein
MSVALLGMGVAIAAPRFLATDPDDVALAEQAWDAATACTGREGAAADDVLVQHRTIPGGWLGVAHTDANGRLFRIDLGLEGVRSAEVLVHEVTHAWISRGPVVLVEGTAELLADCVAGRLRGAAPLQWDDGGDLSGLPDLRTWAPAGDQEPNELGVIRTDAYVGAARLMRTVALAVPPSVLWGASDIDWEHVRGALGRAGPRGEAVIAALDGGSSVQRAALDDADHDGLSALAETWLGTSDDVFDTDGDGWSDGAWDAPAGAIALPPDGTPVCTGRAAPAGGTGVKIVPGGTLRGEDAPSIVPRPSGRPRGWTGATGSAVGAPRLTYVAGGESLLVQLDAPAPDATAGAAWATVEGPELVADGGCRSTAAITVWAADPTLASEVGPLADALAGASDVADLKFGPAPHRLAVALGGAWTGFDGTIVWLGAD